MLERPTTPPTKVESFAGKALLWWLGEKQHARCSGVDITLHHHGWFGDKPWMIEIFADGPGSDRFWHITGKPRSERPTDEEFQEVARSYLQELYRTGKL